MIAIDNPLSRQWSVGVTLFMREGNQSLWENGIFQNCYFLLMLLERSPLVGRTFIVNGGPGNPADAKSLLKHAPAPVLSMQEAMNELDIVVELSAQLNPEWGRDFVDRGGTIVGMRVANDFMIDAERMIHGLPPALLMSGVPYHEIWTLPAFEQSCANYYKTGFRAPVRVMQHLWNPMLLEQSRAANTKVGHFAYRPGRSRWRIAILEPNICAVKTCHLPLLLCDLAHRADPQAIEYLRVYNSLPLKEHRDFVAYARSMDLVRQGLATFEGRFPTFDILATECDAIVSHHWHNSQNYLYYEALYGGYPLIHNSDLIGNCGYPYRSFDPEDGALALIQALREHDLALDSYRADAEVFLRTLDPCADANVRRYSDVLADVLKRRVAG